MSDKQKNKELSKEEKLEFLQDMFLTLDIEDKAKFAQWCHEEVEKGGTELLGRKMEEVNSKMNNFIAKAYDQVQSGAKFVYEKTNQAFEPREETSKKIEKEKGETFFD